MPCTCMCVCACVCVCVCVCVRVCVCVCLVKSHSAMEREAAKEESITSPTEIECPLTPDIVKIVLRSHEGVEADQPFSLLTTQTVSFYMYHQHFSLHCTRKPGPHK